MRCLGVTQEGERAVAVARGEPVQAEVGDQVGGVAAVIAQPVGPDEGGVEIGALVRKHAPVVEAGWPVARPLAEVQLSVDRGRVDAGLEGLGAMGGASWGGSRGHYV